MNNRTVQIATHRLFFFVLASIIAHGTLAAFWTHGFDNRCCALSSSTIEVTLTDIASTNSTSVQRFRGPSQNDIEPTRVASAKDPALTDNQPTTHDALSPKVAHAVTEDTPDSITPATMSSDVEELRAQITAELARYFIYPALARRNNWEGTVKLAITVLPDGRLDGLTLIASSGYAVLDQSALAAMENLKRLPSTGAGLNSSAIDIKLPVTYELKNN